MLDYIRYHAELKGTKIGCREGDCGACTILVGDLINEEIVYKSVTSCLMPIGNARNRHIVTIEGINAEGLTPVQQCFADEGATQCGFCTPGFVVSLTGHCINKKSSTYPDALSSIDGNICRCTGYKSIERAVSRIDKFLQDTGEASLKRCIAVNIIPSYFNEIGGRLKKLRSNRNGNSSAGARIVGGGTDLYVQQHESMIDADINFKSDERESGYIFRNGDHCEVKGNATVSDIASSIIFQEAFPQLEKYMKLISSTQIRNMATIAGNFCNASPIGDLTIFFLALNADLLINNGSAIRTVPLKHFYKAYKIIDLLPGEFVEAISFRLPDKGSQFNFEKVSKRTHLDIASVNTAIYLESNDRKIVATGLSAGGIGPVPLYLEASSDFLEGKVITVNVIAELLSIVQKEISPISDARGSAEYKRLLLSQLIKAHFMNCFPDLQMQGLITGVI